LFFQVLHRKGEINANLDKERRKNRETTGAQFATAKTKERAAWFTDLARGKALSQLAKKVPTIKRREEGLEYLCDYRIPSFRALWYLKVTAALTGSPSTAKQKKSISDLFSAEYKDIFVKSIKELTDRMWDVNDLSTSPIYRDRWLYISNLSKCAFEDGVIERQDFLNELCDIFSEYFVRRVKSEEKLPQLRVYLLFLTQFLRHINNNLILARRLAHMIAMKLRLYKMEYDEQNNTVTKGAEAFIALTKCSALRPVIHVLTTVLQNIVIDAPAAVIWNKFKVSTTDKLPFILSQLCGSPLDLLPCAVHELPLPPGKESERFVELLKLRTAEIVRRSQAVQDKWSFNQKEQFAFAKLVNGCLDVIGILDSADVLEPNILPAVTTRIFSFRSDKWAEEVLIRIKLMLHWAVTAEREGSHRAIVVTKVIYQQVLNQQSYMFGPFHMQDIILNYFYTEAPTPGSKFYQQEFASLVTLFIELSRFKLFVHDCFVKELIKSGELDYQRPIMDKFKCENKPPDPITSSLMSAQFEDLTPDEPAKPTALITYRQEEKDERVYLNDAMSMNDRILIQMPLRQTEEHRSEANQRALVLYGMDDARENHKSEMKKVLYLISYFQSFFILGAFGKFLQIAKEICKIWQKKIYVQFSEGNEAPFWKQSVTSQRIVEILSKFRSQTYYDQMMICGWCAESFSDMIRDFIQGHSLQMPTSEGLDIICGMFESAQYIYGIFEFCEAVTPLLPCAEKVIRSLVADVIPGSMSGQLGYVFVAYICKHWHYFMHSDLAPTITNQLYELIERMIRAHEYPMTSWGRTIAAFVYHSKSQLKKSQLSDIKLHGARDDFRNVFNHGSSSYNGGNRYNALFFKDVFEKKLRFFSYHEYKKRLPSFGQLYNRYSFVINSFIAAKNFMRDHDRLSDLATFCGHISAQIPALADEWVAAIKALCCTSVSQHTGYGELLTHIDVNDCSTHYPIATFVMLLAGKYAFSVPRLIAELLNNAFPVIMKREQSSFVSGRYNVVGRNEYDCEPGACLTLLILAEISCATDEPFHMSEHYVGTTPKTKLLSKCADEIILSMIHWCEMDNVLFPMLSNICILMDTLRARFKDLDFEPSRIVDSTNYRREYLMIMLKAVQLIICEEDWVTMKMFKIVETNRMEAFNHDRLKQNCLGQQLLRLGIRRRSERDVLRELSVCNGNSKKALIDKLLAVMNMWNMRATLFDLMLMIKEISPEGAQKHAQQSAIAADALMGEIGKCCRDLFTNAHKEGLQLSSAILGRDFRFRHVTNFWLIALLVRLCPQPNNVPIQFHHMTVSGKFLKEAASMLDTANDSSKERIQQSTWLLSQQPFLNLVLACLKGEDVQPNKDLLVQSLYKQLLDLTSKTKENPALPLMEKFSAEREGLLLRLSLVGGIFKQICQPQYSEGWSHLFFQMMLYGMVSPDKDRILYDSCYDMLSTLMLWTLTDPSTATQQLSEGSEPKFRWPYYSVIIKKLKKEIADQRVPPELRALLQFLPIPKNTISVFTMEPYGVPSAAAVQKVSGGAARPPSVSQSTPLTGLRHGRYALHVSEKVKTSSYDFIHAYINEQNSKGGWKWSWFQASKIDRLPCPVQKWVARLLVHKHQLEYQRPNAVITESSDHFLSAPAVEATGEAPPPSASSANTPGVSHLLTQTPATPNASAVVTEATTPGNEEIITSLSSAVSTPTTNDVPMDDTTPDQNRSLSSASNPIVSPRASGRGGRKRGNVNRQHSAGSRQKRSASRNEPPGTSVSSFGQGWHGPGANPTSNVLSQPDAVAYSQHQTQQVSSNAVKDPTKTKIQECINKKRLEAAQAARISAGFPGPTVSMPSTIAPSQVSYSDSNFSHHSGNNRSVPGEFQNQQPGQGGFVQNAGPHLQPSMMQQSQTSLDPSQQPQQQMSQQQQMQSAQQPLHSLPPQQQSGQQAQGNVPHSMQPQVMQHMQPHHMQQQIPPQQGMQQAHMPSQTMQHPQVSQQSMMQQQMGQVQRSGGAQGALSGQQFPQISGSAQHQSSMGGPLPMNYQGPMHASQSAQQSQQQPRNTMGQFTSRDGAMSMDYQQGGRGGRQPMQMNQQIAAQGAMARPGMAGSQGHMGPQHIPDGQQVMGQQIGGHSMGAQQMPHQMGQPSMSGQQYYMQQDQRIMNPQYNQSQYQPNNQF
ncbi:transcription mediator subunit Med12, partial [Oesophagostomum dentatum]